MARTFVVDNKLDTRIPYLRGIMTRSLQKAGLTFEAAYTLATTLRDDINHLDEIGTLELRNRVIRILEEQFEASVSKRYQADWIQNRSVLIRSLDRSARLFSRRLHNQRLQALGIPEQQAREISNRLHHELLSRGMTEISSRQLGHLTHRAISREIGGRMAQIYLNWVAFRRSGHPLIVLIGGAPGVGKSTLSVDLASRIEIVRTQSTDMLRDVMCMLMPERLAPVLHKPAITAWQALPGSDISTRLDPNSAIADGYRAQAELISVPCEAVVQRALREKVSLILEGVHIQPTLLERMRPDDSAVVVPLMLAVVNPDELSRRIRNAGGLLPQLQAGDDLRYFDGIWHLQSLLLAEAEQIGTSIINSTDQETAVQDAIRIIMQAIAPKRDMDADAVFGPFGS